MKPFHIALALGMAVVWGINFLMVDVALESFPPLLLVMLRFLVAAVPVLFLPRPRLPWPQLFALAATLFIGQYAFLFTGMAHGMPPGLASLTLQVQAFITILIAALVLGEKPTPRQTAGSAFAIAGLVVIGTTIGGDVSPLGLGLTLLAALSWAIGNVLLRRAGKVDMSALIAWASLVSPLPMLALSLAFEGPAAIAHALAGPSWASIGAVLYVALLSTTFGFGVWGQLLKLYPAATVAPFSLLVPVFGTVAAAIFAGERFGPLRIGGGLLILFGLAVAVLPVGRRTRRVPAAAPGE